MDSDDNSVLSSDFINSFLLKDNLETSDPYDIWMTKLGIQVKKIYYKNNSCGLLPAALMTFFDILVNNKRGMFYSQQEYPVVRAQAALALLNLYEITTREEYIVYAKKHIDWLIENYSKGYSGYCWGMNFEWVSKNGTYPKVTPYITHTPYILEAIVQYQKKSGLNIYNDIIRSIYLFLDKDIKVMQESENFLALSYSPVSEPRIVINANSYAMYMYSLFLDFFEDEKKYIQDKIIKIYNFISLYQKNNGAWFYFADDFDGNFIDCFHSAFILKNIYKTNQKIILPKAPDILKSGYFYIKNNCFDVHKNLFKRFAITDKPSLISYDLYDNAEMLYITKIMRDFELNKILKKSIEDNFVSKGNIYSKMIGNHFRIDKNMLRWAVIPYLLNMTQVV